MLEMSVSASAGVVLRPFNPLSTLYDGLMITIRGRIKNQPAALASRLCNAALGAFATLVTLVAVEATLAADEARPAIRFDEHDVLHHVENGQAKAVSSLLRDAEVP